MVSDAGHQWTANQWSYDEAPGGPSGAWNDAGPCTATPTPTPTPAPGGCTAPAWVSDTAYVSGNMVSSAGHQWTANQWSYDEAPGGPSGAWNDAGPCT